jgi:DNA-binding HxlR family transcriptional regulator
MKLEKITEKPPRSYDDACGTAAALDLIGERWALLVMRELMLGPRRFGDLRTSLPGISANVLTQRLEGLEAAGVVMRKRLPPPAAVQVYDLTDWGREAEPIILSLGRWGARSPLHDASLPLSGVSMMLSFRAMFDTARADGVDVSIAFRFGQDIFGVSVRDNLLTCERGDPHRPDVTVSGSPSAVAGMVYGFVSLADSEADGALTVDGERDALLRFAALFELPLKLCP